MSIIIDTVLTHLPVKRKKTPNGWTSFNCVACVHMGTSNDTRGRGGVHVGPDGISYSCFNCGYKTSWKPGRKISKKFKTLMTWLGIPDDTISKCIIESLRDQDSNNHSIQSDIVPRFFTKELPENSKLISELLDNPPDELLPILEYIDSRGLFLDDYQWYWSDQALFKNRLIIPFIYHNRIVGYTSRSIIPNDKPKYISSQQPGYVFNLDNQSYDREYVIVCEGPIDAIGLDCVAIMGNSINAGQQFLINQLQREVIVVPDKDKAGEKIIQQAIDYQWTVSFPDWGDNIKDINDAIRQYGRLYTLLSIINAKYTNSTKIQLLSKGWFK